MTNLLEVQDINTHIGQFHILEGVSVQVPTGGIVAQPGRNGIGKTTTLKSILGLTPPRSGQVIFGGVEIRAGVLRIPLGIGFVPEHRAIFRPDGAGKPQDCRAQEGRSGAQVRLHFRSF